MKLQISAQGLRLRLSRDDFRRLTTESLSLGCAGWMFTLERGTLTVLENWPAAPHLRLSPRDFDDLSLEPENGIVLTDITPRCEIDIDRRDRPER